MWSENKNAYNKIIIEMKRYKTKQVAESGESINREVNKEKNRGPELKISFNETRSNT